jgi:PKD repeat protein
MQLSNTFTHQWLGLDKRVSMFMVVLSVLSLGLLAYKVASDAPCREVAMAMSSLTNQKTNSFFTNELIHFSAPLEENEIVEWDFGDKSTKLAGAHVTHMFKQAGDYIVTVEINGRCKTTGIVSVKDFVNNANSDVAGSATNDLVKELANPISAESFIIEQGKQLLFSSNVQASSYEWSVEGDLAQPQKTTDKAAYTFLKTGNFTLKLVLNNDPENTWTRVISVTPRKIVDQPVAGGGGQTGPVVVAPPPIPLPKPKPTTPEPEQPRTTTNPTTTQPTTTPVEKPVPQPVGPKVVEVYMDNEQWREMLQDVVSGNASLSDFKMYLNDTEAKMILVDKETISFAELVSRLKDKKIDEKSLQVDQDYDFPNKRLKKLIVKFKKKRGIF